MNLLESFELSLKNIMASKMRTFLTMLGIIIGVTAVILIVGLGNGVKIYMTDQFKSMGTNTLNVMITGRNSSTRKITVDDMYAIVAKNPKYLDKLTPNISMRGTVKIGNESYTSTGVRGVSEDYLAIKQYTLTSGNPITYTDVFTRNQVCMVGTYIASIFGNNTLGQTVKIGGSYFTIVGVVKELSDSTEGSADDAIYVPYTVAARLSAQTINSYVITVVDEDKAAESKQILTDALNEIFKDSNAYRVTSMDEILDTMTNMINILVSVLAIIAGISLVVGGIGIMNIMLVSVTERTKEIGIRKALGAKERYIMSQFVIEAATTSALGGSIGILLGYLLSAVATKFIAMALKENLPVVPTFGSTMMAFGISAGIGIIFGYLPAKKAAVLNPIDALRNE